MCIELQFDCSCPMFLLQCRSILLVLKLISVPDDFRELSELPRFVCLEYNSQTRFRGAVRFDRVDHAWKVNRKRASICFYAPQLTDLIP